MTEYSVVERTTRISAPAEQIAPLLVDYHRWRDWSPWEDLDPDLQRTYTGPDSGVGATYEWSGNRKAGAGSMEVTAVSPTSVDMDLHFTKPFKSESLIHFGLVEDDSSTDVVWQMRMPKTFMTRLVGLFMKMDQAVGDDLDKGLARLKAVAESG